VGRSQAHLRDLVRARDGDGCWICGELIDFTLPPGFGRGPSLEHVVPAAAGTIGRRDPANLRLAHTRPCNHSKGGWSGGVDYGKLSDPAQSAEGRAAVEAYRAQRAERRWFESFSAGRSH
jgi:hypothetical protein